MNRRLAIWLATGAAMAGAVFAPQLAGAAGSGSFSPTGSLTTTRIGARAVLLADGRVLVAGGFNGTTILSSAEAYDPATGGFSSAGIGSMVAPRTDPAAARLPDGRVLFAGGYDGSNYLTSAEAFNPTTGTFGTAGFGSLGTPRADAAAATLPGGRVLVAGGFSNGTYRSSAEIFDPATGGFSPTGSMGTRRDGAVAASLPGGRVLVAGGENASGYLSSAEVYDPASGTFSSAGIGSLGVTRFDASAAPLPDGRVLVAGGYFDDGTPHYPSSAEVFNPATNSFSSTGIGSMSVGHDDPAAAPLPDGRVLVAGGVSEQGLATSAEIYSAANGFRATVKGKKLLVSVQASGKVAVTDAASKLGASGSKKKRKLFLKPSSGSGDPPTVTVPLRLSKLAKAKLRQKGKVTVKARITFAPQGGLAATQTLKLKIKGKARKH